MSNRSVLLEVTEGIATITIHRPDSYNSLDVPTKEQLLESVQLVAADNDVRCVVLTGAGKAFCTGQDLKEHLELLRSGRIDTPSTVERHYTRRSPRSPGCRSL